MRIDYKFFFCHVSSDPTEIKMHQKFLMLIKIYRAQLDYHCPKYLILVNMFIIYINRDWHSYHAHFTNKEMGAYKV